MNEKKENKKEIEKIEKEMLKKEDELQQLQEQINDEDAVYDWLQYRELQEKIEKVELELHDLLVKLEKASS